MDLEQLRSLVIVPAMKIVGLWSPAAENLMMGTLLVESKGRYLKQFHGPALGIFQIEHATHNDIKKFLSEKKRSILRDKILSCCMIPMFLPDDGLIWHLRYATLIARIVYWRYPQKLPEATDAFGLAEYHKRFYNGGALGDTVITKSVKLFQEAIEGKYDD